MASFGDTQAAVVEAQLWDTQVLQARYAAETIAKNVLRKDQLLADYGQLVHIPIKPRFSGGDVTAGTGAFTPEAPTLTEIQVNVNTWKYVGVEIPEKTSKQSIVTLETELPNQFSARLAEFYEAALANLYSNFTGFNTNSPGAGLGAPGSGVDFDDNTATAAVAALRRRNIPLDGMSFFLPTEAWYFGWLLKERLTLAYATGLDKSTLITGARQPILGIPAYESNILNGSSATDDSGNALNPATAPNLPGTSVGFLAHKEALAMVLQLKNCWRRYDAAAANKIANGVVVSELFGVNIGRATHGVPIYVRNNQ